MIGLLLLRATLILLLALVLDVCLRRRAVLACAATWNAVLLGLIILSATAVLVPPVTLPLLPATNGPAPIPLTPPGSLTGSNESPGSSSMPAVNTAPSLMGSRIAARPATAADNAQPPSEVSLPRDRFIFNWSNAIAIIYSAGVTICLLRFVVGLAAIRAMNAASSPVVNETWQRSLTRWKSRLGCEHVELRKSSNVGVPLMAGWFQPVILLPEHMVGDLPQESRDAVIVHEMAHILRGDYGWQLLLRLVQATLWFHPLMWLAERRIHFIRERACDEFSVYALGDGDTYAETLLAIAGRIGRGLSLSLGLAVVRTPQITARIEALVGSQGIASCLLPARVRNAIACLCVVLCGGLGSLSIGRAQQPAITSENQSHKLATDAAKAETTEASKAAPSKATGNENKGDESSPIARKVAYNCVVVDAETGQGIPNASVTVTWLAVDQGAPASMHITDDAGKYTVKIPPDQLGRQDVNVNFVVKHDGYVTNPESNSAYSLKHLLSDEAQGKRPFFERIQLQPAIALTGRVVSPEGIPLPNVWIRGYTSPRDRMSGRTTSATFLETRTGSDGTFHLKRVKSGTALLTLITDDYAITELKLDDKASELGDIRLLRGTRISGRALKADGTPATGIPFNAVRGDNESYEAAGGWIRRGTATDAEGRFMLAPLPPGNYRLESPVAAAQQQADIFIAQVVTLAEGQPIMPLELRAVPQITFHAQTVTSPGAQTAGRLSISGMIDGRFWTTNPVLTRNGTTDIRLPRGLQNTNVGLTTSDESSLRIRRTKGAELENYFLGIELGTLNDDYDGFEIIRYTSPVVLVRAVDEIGQPIKGFQVTGTYPGQKNARFPLENGQTSDIRFGRVDDGRFRSAMMLPDEDAVLEITAPNYDTFSASLNLKEGETKELSVTLKTAMK